MLPCRLTVAILLCCGAISSAQATRPTTGRPLTVPSTTPATQPDRLALLRQAADRADAELLRARADCLRRMEASEPYKALVADLAAKQARLDEATPGRDGAGIKFDEYAVLGARRRIERMRDDVKRQGDAATAKAEEAAKRAHAAYVAAFIKEKGSILADHHGAKRVVFVCDAGGFMINKFATLKDQLSNAISSLRPDQEFGIVFFADGKAVAMNEKSLIAASPENKRAALEYLDGVTTTGKSRASPAVAMAFGLKPHMIHLVIGREPDTDDKLAEEIRKMNRPKQVSIHVVTIDVYSGEAGALDLLRAIAAENGGRFDQLFEAEMSP